MCAAYLRFAQEQPRRYLIMFGGVWNAGRAGASGSLEAGQVTTLGAAALEVLATALQGADASRATATDGPPTGAVVLWVGLHGLAHQRLVAPGFPWPSGIDDRLVAALTAPNDDHSRHRDRGRPRP